MQASTTQRTWLSHITIGLTLLLVLHSCQDEEIEKEKITPSVVQFSESEQNVVEGVNATLTLHLNQPAPAGGAIQLSVGGNAIYGQHYETSPAAIDGVLRLDVAKGASSVQIDVTTIVTNSPPEDLTYITFTLVSVSDVLQIKGNTTSIIVVEQDEDELDVTKSGANFEVNAATVMESNATGTEVKIKLSKPTEGPGSLVVRVNDNGAVYEQDFITSPQVIDEKITLDFLANETSKSFFVIPVHNLKATTNQQISFVITAASGVLQKGTSLTYSLTIINEDVVSTVGFAESSRILEEHNVTGIIIDIPFSAQSSGEGSITISLAGIPNAVYGSDFTTIPPMDSNGSIELPVAFEQESASFKVLPNNDGNCTLDARSVEFRIAFANGSVEKGSNLNCLVTLNDDEKVNSISFNKTNESIYENSQDKITVKLLLSEPLKQDATIYLNFIVIIGLAPADSPLPLKRIATILSVPTCQ